MALEQASGAVHDTMQSPVVGQVMAVPSQPLAVLQSTLHSALVGHTMLEYCEEEVIVTVVSA